MNWFSALMMFSAVLASAACGAGGPPRHAANSSTAAAGSAASASTAESAVSENNPEPANAKSENPQFASRNKKLEEMRSAGNVQPSTPAEIEAMLGQSTRPAPENSEFSVALTDILVERRTFKQHEILAKVEKITDGPKKTIYVFMKDGTKRELLGETIESISTAQTSAILRAIGVEPKSSGVSGRKPDARGKN